MKLFVSSILICLYTQIVFSQPTIVQWERGYGGSYKEEGENIIQKANGNFVICGYTNSNDYDATSNHSISYDLWFVNLNDSGNLVSQKCYGGTFEEKGKSVSIINNQFLLYGSARSQDYDLAGIHNLAFAEDLWLLRIDSALNISFQKTFGSSSSDEPLKMLGTSQGNYIFLGKIGMTGNDVDTNYGDKDLWVVKTDSAANIIWQTTLGSTYNDEGGDVVETNDGGYLVVGGVGMYSGNVSCAPGSGSIWIIKLDSIGGIIWQKCYSSAYAKKVIATNDGGFVVAALTFDNTISGYSGLSDYLLLKLDSLGNQQWAHCYGGSQFDTPSDLIQCSDGGFLVAGTSDSYDFYATTNHGGSKDALLVKIDSLGNFQWSQCYGGIDNETCTSVIETSDGGLALTGSTKSIIGLPHYGEEDLWVLKLNYSGNGIFTPNNSIDQLILFSTADGIGIELSSKKNQDVLISIFDISGRKLLSDNFSVIAGKSRLNYSLDDVHGVFLVQVNTIDGRAVNKMVK